MNLLKSGHFFNRFSQLVFDLRSGDHMRSCHAKALLALFANVRLNWHDISHHQALNIIASDMGYTGSTDAPWKEYKQYFNKTMHELRYAHQHLEKNFGERLHDEDRAASEWYMHLINNHLKFENRAELLKKYLQIRKPDFKRYELHGLKLIVIDFPLKNRINFNESIDLTAVEKSFSESSMDWLYVYDSCFLLCNFSDNYFRNAMFHNVDLRDAVFSTKASNGDFMGANFCFCDIRFSRFSYCYARELIMYKTNMSYTQWNNSTFRGGIIGNSSLIGTNFSNSAMYNMTFRDSDMRGADFTGVNVHNTEFIRCDLRNAKGLDLNSVKIDNSRLS